MTAIHTNGRVQSPSLLREPPVRRRRRRSTMDWAGIYCTVLGEIGQMKKAAQAAGVTLRTVQLRRKTDPAFVEQERCALEVLCDILESEAIRRAVEGVREEHFDGHGQLVYARIRYSDTLLLRLLEKLDPTWRRDYRPKGRQSGFHTRAEREAALEKAALERRSKGCP